MDVPMTKAGVNLKISAVELAAHQRDGDPWFAIKGEVSQPAITIPHITIVVGTPIGL